MSGVFGPLAAESRTDWLFKTGTSPASRSDDPEAPGDELCGKVDKLSGNPAASVRHRQALFPKASDGRVTDIHRIDFECSRHNRGCACLHPGLDFESRRYKQISPVPPAKLSAFLCSWSFVLGR